MGMNQYPVVVEHIYVSPGHNYFGKPKDGPGGHETRDVASVRVHAGLGIEGDRYFAVPAHFNAQITFIDADVLEDVRARLALEALDPIQTRRNIVLRGVPLLQLIGQEFTLDFGDEQVEFEGASHCAPCAWMDAMYGEGAREALRGRGGLRARILTDGEIRRGRAMLTTDAPLDLGATTAPLKYPAIP